MIADQQGRALWLGGALIKWNNSVFCFPINPNVPLACWYDCFHFLHNIINMIIKLFLLKYFYFLSRVYLLLVFQVSQVGLDEAP